MKVVALALLSCVLLTSINGSDIMKPPEDTNLSKLSPYFREEMLSLKEEMYSLFSEGEGTGILALQVLELVREVGDSVKRLEGRIEDLSGKQQEIVSSFNSLSQGMSSNFEGLTEQTGLMEEKVEKVGKKIDVIRSEVRLISQHKLTWQNTTWDDVYHSDFAVDGVYTKVATHGGSSSNPMQKSGQSPIKGNILLIDLGGFFKIHTIKLWNRLDSNDRFADGVLIYVDEQLVGSVHDVQKLYNFRVNPEVYGKKVYFTRFKIGPKSCSQSLIQKFWMKKMPQDRVLGLFQCPRVHILRFQCKKPDEKIIFRSRMRKLSIFSQKMAILVFGGIFKTFFCSCFS